jgi:hypothetical protein
VRELKRIAPNQSESSQSEIFSKSDVTATCENSKDHSETSSKFSDPKKHRETFVHSDVLASSFGVPDVAPSARNEYDVNHET